MADRRKQDQTNHEVIQQNMQLHTQLRASQKSWQEATSEVVDLRRRVSQLEMENRHLLTELTIIKREVGDRAPTLDLVSRHISELSRFMEAVSLGQVSEAHLLREQKENMHIDLNDGPSRSGRAKQALGKPQLASIDENQEYYMSQ